MRRMPASPLPPVPSTQVGLPPRSSAQRRISSWLVVVCAPALPARALRPPLARPPLARPLLARPLRAPPDERREPVDEDLFALDFFELGDFRFDFAADRLAMLVSVGLIAECIRRLLPRAPGRRVKFRRVP